MAPDYSAFQIDEIKSNDFLCGGNSILFAWPEMRSLPFFLHSLLALADRPELIVAALRTAGPVVEIGPLVAAVHDRGESVVTVHDGFDEDQRVVRRAEGGLQVPNGFDDERSRRGIATEHLR